MQVIPVLDLGAVNDFFFHQGSPYSNEKVL